MHPAALPLDELLRDVEFRTTRGPGPGGQHRNKSDTMVRVTHRPTGSPSLRELTDYVYFRDNVAGVQREWWQHRTGCGEWFLAERDTRTNEVQAVSLPHDGPTGASS